MQGKSFKELRAEMIAKDPGLEREIEIETMKLLPSKIAFILTQERKKKKITQEELAAEIGTGQSYIARFERGKQTAVTIKTLIKIAEALGCKLDFTIKPLTPVKQTARPKLKAVKPVARPRGVLPARKALKKAA